MLDNNFDAYLVPIYRLIQWLKATYNNLHNSYTNPLYKLIF
jgi:hypothetical protein